MEIKIQSTFTVELQRGTRETFIAGLENQLGEWIKDEGQIGGLLIQYYSRLFTSSNPSGFESVPEGVEPRVTSDMNDELLRPFEAIDVHNALKQMELSTTPGPDGLPLLFYKQY